jgi:predicted Zn-dependent protease
MQKLFLFFLFAIFMQVAYAQQDMQLAMKYYNAKEYDKAEVLFDKLYKQRKTKFYFDYYIDCLIFQEKFKEAEKRINKEIKKHPENLTFYIDLGYVKKKNGNENEAEKQYKYVLKNLPENINKIQQIANSFARKREYEWAEKVYLKGNNLFDDYFLQQLANIYALERKNELMIDTYY